MTIEELLDEPYLVIDILPVQVPYNSAGRYFDVEQYFLHSPLRKEVRAKFVSLILKLYCYFDMTLVIGEEDSEQHNPDPQMLADQILQEEESLSILVKEALITINPDDLYMTVYHADEPLKNLLTPLAQAEGLFLRTPENGNT